MLLTKKQNTNIKNSYLWAISALLVAALGLFLTHPAQASNSSVGAQVCQDGPKTPTISSVSPANNATVFTNNGNLSIVTSWGKRLTVRLNGTQIFDQNVAYQDNVTTSVPFNNLNPLPQVNAVEISLAGGCPESTTTQNINLNYNAQILSFNLLNTNVRSPRLSGNVNNPALGVRVFISSDPTAYIATNNGDGTWSLPAGTIPELPDGEYDVVVESYDLVTSVTSQRIELQKGLIIDTVAPNGTFTGGQGGDSNSGSGGGTFNGGTFNTRSPGFDGTTDDPTAIIKIEINGETYTAINNGDGTWSLPAGTIRDLANGEYDITVTFSDRAGNVFAIQGTVRIDAPNQIGFLIPPNTGYLRIGRTNIPSWAIYLTVIGIIGTIVIAKRKKTTA